MAVSDNASDKKAIAEPPVTVEDAQDEVAVESKSEEEVVTVLSEKTSTQGALSKSSQDEFDLRPNEGKEPASDKAKSMQPKNTESLSKDVPAAAFSAMRETEFADVKVDASQLQRAPLQEAIHLYQAGAYEEAFQKAEKFLKKFPKDAEGLFYSGVSALSLKKEQVAAERLENCLATGAQQWKEEASWYLSLCYVKLGRSSDARPLLEFLAGGSSEHAGEAKRMLESIH